MRSSLLVVGLLFALVSLAPAPAHAQDPAGQAKSLAAQGTARYQVGLFDEALRLYEAAYKVHPVPALIFNIAQCQRQLKNYDKAAFLYRSFLRSLPDAPNRAQVEEIIKEMDRLAGEQRRAGIAPPGQNLNVESGTPAVAAPLTARPAVTSGTATDEPEGRPWYKKWWVWTIVGVVVAGGAVGGAVAATRGGSPGPVPSGSLGNMTFGFGGQR